MYCIYARGLNLNDVIYFNKCVHWILFVLHYKINLYKTAAQKYVWFKIMFFCLLLAGKCDHPSVSFSIQTSYCKLCKLILPLIRHSSFVLWCYSIFFAGHPLSVFNEFARKQKFQVPISGSRFVADVASISYKNVFTKQPEFHTIGFVPHRSFTCNGTYTGTCSCLDLFPM